jgi:hypothetical protein
MSSHPYRSVFTLVTADSGTTSCMVVVQLPFSSGGRQSNETRRPAGLRYRPFASGPRCP